MASWLEIHHSSPPPIYIPTYSWPFGPKPSQNPPVTQQPVPRWSDDHPGSLQWYQRRPIHGDRSLAGGRNPARDLDRLAVRLEEIFERWDKSMKDSFERFENNMKRSFQEIREGLQKENKIKSKNGEKKEEIKTSEKKKIVGERSKMKGRSRKKIKNKKIKIRRREERKKKIHSLERKKKIKIRRKRRRRTSGEGNTLTGKIRFIGVVGGGCSDGGCVAGDHGEGWWPRMGGSGDGVNACRGELIGAEGPLITRFGYGGGFKGGGCYGEFKVSMDERREENKKKSKIGN